MSKGEKKETPDQVKNFYEQSTVEITIGGVKHRVNKVEAEALQKKLAKNKAAAQFAPKATSNKDAVAEIKQMLTDAKAEAKQMIDDAKAEAKAIVDAAKGGDGKK